MSYDLTLKPSADAEAIRAWFRRRPFYTWNDDDASYENPATGVYFSFGIRADHVWFNLNYARPHTFGLEAVDEVAAFVADLGCAVDDPQGDGMGDGPFTREGFLRGWNHGNQFAHDAMKQMNALQGRFALPAAVNRGVWKWNRSREAYVERLGTVHMRPCFVPTIMLLEDQDDLGKVLTAVVWGDAMELALPEVDLVLAISSSGVPRALPRTELLPALTGADRVDADHTFDLDGETHDMGLPHLLVDPVPEAAKRVLEVAGTPRKFKRIAVDQILDSELA